jgi:hypothetical protein
MCFDTTDKLKGYQSMSAASDDLHQLRELSGIKEMSIGAETE